VKPYRLTERQVSTLSTDIDFTRIDSTRHLLAGYSPVKAFDQSNPPERFQKLIERVKLNDKLYFKKNPQATTYTRPYCPGEFWPANLDFAVTVTVTRSPATEHIRARVSLNQNPKRHVSDQTSAGTVDLDANILVNDPSFYNLLNLWLSDLIKSEYVKGRAA
jgi:hypothetical protein